MVHALRGEIEMADMISELRRHCYRELAIKLRELARQANFPAARRELVALARRFDTAVYDNGPSGHHRGVGSAKAGLPREIVKPDQGIIWNDCRRR
jgi:hypothetical protein